MTEYRVVATVDTEHVYNGQKYHYDASGCWYHGRCHRLQTFDKERAKEYLKEAKVECAIHDRKTQESTDRYTIRYWQTNIRIQTREVTEWK